MHEGQTLIFYINYIISLFGRLIAPQHMHQPSASNANVAIYIIAHGVYLEYPLPGTFKVKR
jgi:hypothetical protein